MVWLGFFLKSDFNGVTMKLALLKATTRVHPGAYKKGQRTKEARGGPFLVQRVLLDAPALPGEVRKLVPPAPELWFAVVHCSTVQ